MREVLSHACGELTVRTFISVQALFISGQLCPDRGAALPKIGGSPAQNLEQL